MLQVASLIIQSKIFRFFKEPNSIECQFMFHSDPLNVQSVTAKTSTLVWMMEHSKRLVMGLRRVFKRTTSSGPSVVPDGKKMPTARGFPLVGTTLSIMAAGGAAKLHLYVDKRHKELGPIYREKIGPVSGVFVSDPEFMRKVFSNEGKYPRHVLPESWMLYNDIYGCKRGLLFMDGEEWLSFRKILNNIILKPNNDELVAAVEIAAQDLVNTWKKDGKIVNLEEQLYKWSLEVILSVLLGARNYQTSKGDLSKYVEELSKVVHDVFIESANLSLIPAKLAMRLNLPGWKRFVTSVNVAVTKANEIIDIILPEIAKGKETDGLLKKIQDTGMTREDMYRIVTDLILAAGDTTAFSTQWLLHLLSQDAKLQDEIRKEFQGAEEGIHSSSLLRGALREALRLYPVAPFVTRYLAKDSLIGEYRVSAGELIIMSLYTSGRNEKFFPQSEAFLPQRWTRNASGYKGVWSPYASLPFAMGPRSCIGKKIAEIQIYTTVSKILNQFQLQAVCPDDIEMTLHMISVPSKPINIAISPRKAHDNF